MVYDYLWKRAFFLLPVDPVILLRTGMDWSSLFGGAKWAPVLGSSLGDSEGGGHKN